MKNQYKINNKIYRGKFQRDFSRKLLQKSGDNLLKKSRKKSFLLCLVNSLSKNSPQKGRFYMPFNAVD